MNCPKCGSPNLSKSGKRWVAGSKKQQYLCSDCGHRTVNLVIIKGGANAK